MYKITQTSSGLYSSLFTSRIFAKHCYKFSTDPGELEYQAQSPDEAALVTAARNFGFVFLVCGASEDITDVSTSNTN